MIDISQIVRKSDWSNKLGTDSLTHFTIDLVAFMKSKFQPWFQHPLDHRNHFASSLSESECDFN